MRKKGLTILAMAIGASILFPSCEKEEDESNEVEVSAYNETESHYMGQNCMSCHQSGGSGEGWFNLAGTVYDSLKTSPYPNTTVKLYGGPNGTGNLKGTIQVDGLGNFYTTDAIDFGNTLYVSVSGDSTTQHMGAPISSGQCNGCHGVSTDRIWAK